MSRAPAARLAVFAIVAALVLSACPARHDPALPVLGKIPAFSLTAEDGTPFGSAELAGHPWVANFIFTRCPDICPAFTARMAEVQTHTAALSGALVLISFSVDPTHDTPAVLAGYAKAHGADGKRWRFLTGAETDVRHAVEDGMKIAMENKGEQGGVPNIAHGSHFVLVDGAGQIRGYYDMNDTDAVARVVRDATRLTRAQR